MEEEKCGVQPVFGEGLHLGLTIECALPAGHDGDLHVGKTADDNWYQWDSATFARIS